MSGRYRSWFCIADGDGTDKTQALPYGRATAPSAQCGRDVRALPARISVKAGPCGASSSTAASGIVNKRRKCHHKAIQERFYSNDDD
jgi:hypothetical protein